jgi:hypothetical protein
MDAGPIHVQSVGSGDASQLSGSVEVIETRAGSVKVVETLAGNMTAALLDFILRVGQRKNAAIIVASESKRLGELYHLMNEHHRDARQRHVAKQWKGTCVYNPSRVGFCRNQHLVVVVSNRQEMKRFLAHIQSQEFISKLGDGWSEEMMASSKIVAFSLGGHVAGVMQENGEMRDVTREVVAPMVDRGALNDLRQATAMYSTDAPAFAQEDATDAAAFAAPDPAFAQEDATDDAAFAAADAAFAATDAPAFTQEDATDAPAFAATDAPAFAATDASLVREDLFASIGVPLVPVASIGDPFTFAPESTRNIKDSWCGDTREAASPGKRLASAEPPEMPHAPMKIGRFEMDEGVIGQNMQPMLDELLLFGVDPPPPPPPAASGHTEQHQRLLAFSIGVLEAHQPPKPPKPPKATLPKIFAFNRLKQPFVEPPSPVASTELGGSNYPALPHSLPHFGAGSYARSVETDLDGASVMDTDGVHPNTDDVDGPLVMMLLLHQRALGKPFQGLVGVHAFGVSPTPGKAAASVARALTKWRINPTNAKPCNSCEVAFGEVKARVTCAFIGAMEM